MPDPKYLKGRVVPGYQFDKDVVAWIKRWRAAGFGSAEYAIANHFLRQVMGIMGEPPEPRPLPSLPDGTSIKPPRKRKKN